MNIPPRSDIAYLTSRAAERHFTDAERLRERMSVHLRNGKSMAEAERIAASELKLYHMVAEDY